MLLHNVHFEGAVLREPGLAVRALVRLFACVTKLMSLQVKGICEGFPANVARKWSFPSMRPINCFIHEQNHSN